MFLRTSWFSKIGNPFFKLDWITTRNNYFYQPNLNIYVHLGLPFLYNCWNYSILCYSIVFQSTSQSVRHRNNISITGPQTFMKFCSTLYIGNRLLLLRFSFVRMPENRFLNLEKFCIIDIFTIPPKVAYRVRKNSVCTSFWLILFCHPILVMIRYLKLVYMIFFAILDI